MPRCQGPTIFPGLPFSGDKDGRRGLSTRPEGPGPRPGGGGTGKRGTVSIGRMNRARPVDDGPGPGGQPSFD